jgi:sarcosine oxidase
LTAYDVAVIGLGAMGSATLFHLARRGRRVIGIEQFKAGHDRGSSHGESRAIRLGYFEHPSYVPLLRRAFENWREVEKLSGETIQTVTGVLEIGKPDSIVVAGSLEASRLHGLDHEVLDATGIRKRYPQFTLPDDYSAVWQPDGGLLPPELGNAIHLRLARAAGAEVLTGAKVLGLEPHNSAVRLTLRDDRTIAASSVVVCAGAWIADLLPELKPHLVLSRQVLCWFAPSEPQMVGLGTLPVFIVDGEDDTAYGFPVISDAGFKCASHLSSGTLGHADTARQDAGARDEARMRRFLDRYLPAAAGPLKAMKTCIYTKTPDEDFVIDLHPDDSRVVIASPCSGHGYKFASVIGEVLADLATERTTKQDISRFRIGRFGAA